MSPSRGIPHVNVLERKLREIVHHHVPPISVGMPWNALLVRDLMKYIRSIAGDSVEPPYLANVSIESPAEPLSAPPVEPLANPDRLQCRCIGGEHGHIKVPTLPDPPTIDELFADNDEPIDLRVTEGLTEAIALRELSPGNPLMGPYPSSLDEVADEICAFLVKLERDTATPNALLDMVVLAIIVHQANRREEIEQEQAKVAKS